MDLKKLRELAGAATPGPWYDDSEWSPHDVSIWQGDKPVDEAEFIANVGHDGPVRAFGHVRDADISDGRFIAAVNPASVIALIDEIEALTGLYVAVMDHRAMYEGTSDEFNMSEQTIADEMKKIEQMLRKRAT